MDRPQCDRGSVQRARTGHLHQARRRDRNPEYNLFFNTLISADIGQKWNVGVNLPLVYKYLVDPRGLALTTAIAALAIQSPATPSRANQILVADRHSRIPTGVHDAHYNPTGIPIYLNQSEQIDSGSGRARSSWITPWTRCGDLIVLGGAAAWRGERTTWTAIGREWHCHDTQAIFWDRSCRFWTFPDRIHGS